MSTFHVCLFVAAMLFAVGLGGVLTRRNAILILMGIELMLNAANLSFVTFWRFGPSPESMEGVMFALFAIAIAAAEAAIGLALLIVVYRHFRTTDVEAMDQLKG
jgi:NADH-quinone oxidoreductase subunit K